MLLLVRFVVVVVLYLTIYHNSGGVPTATAHQRRRRGGGRGGKRQAGSDRSGQLPAEVRTESLDAKRRKERWTRGRLITRGAIQFFFIFFILNVNFPSSAHKSLSLSSIL